MFKRLRDGLLVTLFLFFCTAVIAQELLYQTPSYENLEKFAMNNASQGDLSSDKHSNNLINILITAFLKTHPHMVDQIITQFNNYPEKIKPIFANALIAIEGPHIIERLQYSLPPAEKPLSITDVDKIDLTTLRDTGALAKIPDATDYLWAAFEGSGDKTYLIKILQYLGSETPENKMAAMEILNREALSKAVNNMGIEGVHSQLGLKELKEEIDKLSKNNPNYSWEKASVYSIVLWSMNSQRKQYPSIEANVAEIVNNNPALNYRK